MNNSTEPETISLLSLQDKKRRFWNLVLLLLLLLNVVLLALVCLLAFSCSSEEGPTTSPSEPVLPGINTLFALRVKPSTDTFEIVPGFSYAVCTGPDDCLRQICRLYSQQEEGVTLVALQPDHVGGPFCLDGE